MSVIPFRNAHRSKIPFVTTYIIILYTVLILNGNVRETQGKEITIIEIGKNITMDCMTTVKNITWKHDGKVIDTSSTNSRILVGVAENVMENSTDSVNKNKFLYTHSISIRDVHINDNGTYTCESALNDTRKIFIVQIFLPAHVIENTKTKIKQRIGNAVTLFCLIEVFPLNETFLKQLKWLKDEESLDFLDTSATYSQINITKVNFTLELTEVYKKENGSYSCVIFGANSQEISRKEITLLVMDVPHVSIDYVKAVGANKIFLNWTSNDGNDPIQKYYIQYMQEGSPNFAYYNQFIEGKNNSYLLENFLPNTSYSFRIYAKNNIGDGVPLQYPYSVRTLHQDPIFVPKVETTGSTSSTITIGWNPPPNEILEFIQYYELVVSESGEVPKVIEEAIYQQNSRNLPYMFDNLKTATEYEFKVRACSDLTKYCGPWSEVVNGTTMDGIATKPTELNVICKRHNISNTPHLNSVIVSWNSPKTPNGKVISYLIQLEGISTYKFDGQMRKEIWGPKIRRVDEPNHKAIFDGVNPNTNYTVNVSAITRHKKNGETAVGKCVMPVSVPENIDRVIWTKVKISSIKCVFKLIIPKVSEKNGPICCYRLYLIRMSNLKSELPSPDKIPISTYQAVHSPNNTVGGAYIAEMFSTENFKSEIFLGDGKRYFENDIKSSVKNDDGCRKCLDGVPFLKKFKMETEFTKETPKKISKPISPVISQRDYLSKAGNLTAAASKILENKRRKRRKVVIDENSQTNWDNSHNQGTTHSNSKLQNIDIAGNEEIMDGEIDMESNYTGFLEIIVRDKNVVMTAFSNYFEIITPGTEAEHYQALDNISNMLNFVILVLAILIGIVLVLLFILWFLHRYNTKNTEPGDEAISLRDSIRALFGSRTSNHRHFIGPSNAKTTDLGPIHKSDLCAAYKSRHKDTDYGFLHEFELLPNRFSDRTTKNSDLKENFIKNRYPDIKAYDQTRVKLSLIHGVHGSDYINANFVIGYKERKKFICAQGPMESTINDFWRMIWEQHLEIIIMLTNLEEYNKSKCAKYWPEKISDSKQYGDITVKFVAEKKNCEYIIREIDVFRRVSGDEEERRQITQYHYLMWKDFMAPEHPQGIIKFIRHINGVYSVQRGPILVHCSAGVGRTGTFVALDSLMQQLQEEDQVSIYNTVCDLRHQRNFLVQSLKQYIFLYRALLDTALFGNTELNAIGLSTTVENLKKNADDSKDKSKLEMEFERLFSVCDEINKSFTIGSSDENMPKNRIDTIVPYDRNRVILTPIPSKEHSTYINASFIEGYENADIFIITQDPMENTIGDFWRMISEQSISTIVMISEIGEGTRKCPRYWADDEIQFEHIRVKYMQSENCPYYTRREFEVTNGRIDDTIKVTQFQYNGWPTVEGEVPEVCRGIIELVDQAQSHHNKHRNSGCRSPLAVHCSLGTDRSSIFVAMCILVQQLRCEGSVDICSTVRKIRSQRLRLLDTYAQYEFLHRAIANYADLHKLSMESFSDC